MRGVFSVVFWTYLVLSCATLFLVAAAVWLLTLPFDRNGRVLHLFTCAWAAHYLYINPLWGLRVEGARAVDRRRAYVIACNHQSFADILVVSASYLPFKWVSKASVFRVPFIGWTMRLNGYVALVRGDKQSVERMAAASRRWLARGVSVAMFPEGTRSKDGALGPFKVGAFRIAREAGVPVLPLVLDGTADALPKHGVVINGLARPRLRVLDPIDVAGFESDDLAASAVRARMAEALEEMRKQK